MSVGERDVSLTSFLNLLNKRPYDCRALIDERLLGNFGLSPQVEPLEESFANTSGTMLRERRVGTPLPRVRQRNPASSSSKGKRPMSPPSRMPNEGPAKRTRTSSLGTPPISSSKHSVTPPPPPPPPTKEEKGVSSRSPSLLGGGGGGFFSGCFSDAGGGDPEDQRLLAPLGREEKDCPFLFPAQGMAACETLFSRYQGVPAAVSVDTPSKKMEEKVKRLEKENAQLREAKKEAANHRAQMERELKRLSKESAEHEKVLRRAVEKAVHNYPNSEEGKNFLKAY
ncbi:UNVERIFIED_CONTAM: hypothetical protein Slati_0166200 [Sesamum latifolium]|uniref:Uncharacterized protein n=1 Tax=Sesamum latifolium TaxID=2727402 RepID=A0AAW2YAX3_9LAMI